MWYTLDQWEINKGRQRLYNDHVHFVGPLTFAALTQMLNIVCPNGGSSRGSNDNGLANSKQPMKTPVLSTENATQHQSVSPSTSAGGMNVSTASAILSQFNGKATKSYSGKQGLFLIENGFLRRIPNMDTFYSLQLELGELNYLDDAIIDSAPRGADIPEA